MKIEIKNKHNGNIILCGEYESVKDCLERNQTANLSFANLSSANLRSANLRSADLSSADLSFADLSSADLSSANLSFADLRSANLSSAITDKRYIQISCIGSRKGMTTYCFEDNIIWCGCWNGTLKDFEERVKETHKKNKKYLAEYMGFISYIKSLRKEK